MTSARTFLVAAMLLLQGAGEALACKCEVHRISVRRQVANAKRTAAAVFSGKVTQIESADNGWRLIVYFSVDEVWKGKINRETTVSTLAEGSNCGFTFQAGTDYLVYCSRSGIGELWTSRCTRTGVTSASSVDRRYLGRFSKPAPAKPSDSHFEPRFDTAARVRRRHKFLG